MRKLISSGSDMEEKYGYSRAVVQGNWAFVSGTTGMNYTTNEMPEDIATQTENCIRNIEWALKEAKGDLEHIVRLETFLVEGARAAECFDVLGRVFGQIRPANTAVFVSALIDPRMLVEIQATAILPEEYSY
jgi:enamine deaminase RidA (YjgF/YER057c/UK114 family)